MKHNICHSNSTYCRFKSQDISVNVSRTKREEISMHLKDQYCNNTMNLDNIYKLAILP